MSIVPMIFSDWWEDLERPHSVRNQHFGLPFDPADEFFHRSATGATSRHADHLGYPFFRRMRRRHHPFHHALARRYSPQKGASSSSSSSSSSIVHSDKDYKFHVVLDVQQFLPDEITVKTIDRSVVVVEAKHEEREDEHGWISREFTRKYNVPSYYDVEQIETFLSSDGVLTITAPRRKMPGDNNEKIVKIQYTGEPAIIERNDKSTKFVEGQTGEFTRGQHSQQRAQMGQQRGKKINVKGS